MELFPFDDECIAYFSTHDDDQDLRVVFVHVIQDSEIPEPEFKAG
jgi:hypothetical protein